MLSNFFIQNFIRVIHISSYSYWFAIQACAPKWNRKEKHTYYATKNSVAECRDSYVSKTPGNWFSTNLTGATHLSHTVMVCRPIQQNMLIVRAEKDAIWLITDICETPDFSVHQSVCRCDGFLVQTHQQILIVSRKLWRQSGWKKDLWKVFNTVCWNNWNSLGVCYHLN